MAYVLYFLYAYGGDVYAYSGIVFGSEVNGAHPIGMVGL